MPSPARWDIFCQVIDNYGDIGVCWRLARQLSVEHAIDVRLWVDDLTSLQPLSPDVDIYAERQRCSGVEVCHWVSPFSDQMPAEVVIEAFGCNLPDNYLAAMAACATKPVWINLEYLSAESWVEGCHSMASPHPRLPLTKYFFFPGFTPATGGLLREKDLFSQRARLQQHPGNFWHALHLSQPTANETVVSLFCYDTAPIAPLLRTWEAAPHPVRCLLPVGKALPQVAAHISRPMLVPGDQWQRGNLTLHILPFLRQQAYDELLWACDVNFVRGEDSFVRAQWAAKPMVWQIYKQEEHAHFTKLDAFLDRYCAAMAPSLASSVRTFYHAWNGDGSALAWDSLIEQGIALEQHATNWATSMAKQADLASNLVIFCKNRV